MRGIAVPNQYSIRHICSLVCCIFGFEEGRNFSLLPAAHHRRKVADPMSITPGLHAYCPMAFREDAVAVGTKDLYAPYVVFRGHDHVLSLGHCNPPTQTLYVSSLQKMARPYATARVRPRVGADSPAFCANHLRPKVCNIVQTAPLRFRSSCPRDGMFGGPPCDIGTVSSTVQSARRAAMR
jgi:hypothetical protein